MDQLFVTYIPKPTGPASVVIDRRPLGWRVRKAGKASEGRLFRLLNNFQIMAQASDKWCNVHLCPGGSFTCFIDTRLLGRQA